MGLVYVEEVTDRSDEGEFIDALPDRSDIQGGTAAQSPSYFYGLTDAGGQVWEALAKPNWSLFFQDTYFEMNGREFLELCSLTMERIAYLLPRFAECFSLELSPVPQPCGNRQSPWAATYWKTFSEGAKERS